MKLHSRVIAKYKQPLILRLAIWSDEHPRLCSGLSYAVIFGLVFARITAKARRLRRILAEASLKEGLQQDAA